MQSFVADETHNITFSLSSLSSITYSFFSFITFSFSLLITIFLSSSPFIPSFQGLKHSASCISSPSPRKEEKEISYRCSTSPLSIFFFFILSILLPHQSHFFDPIFPLNSSFILIEFFHKSIFSRVDFFTSFFIENMFLQVTRNILRLKIRKQM